MDLRDSVLTINTNQWLFPDGSTIDVQIEDSGGAPVIPDSVNRVGQVVTVVVPSGGSSPVGATLMKTGQTVSYVSNDDGQYQAGRLTDFFTLAVNNPFGNTKRFTGITGGYQSGGSYFDKDGIGTTSALAIPSDIVIDWSTYDTITSKANGWKRTFVAPQGKVALIATIEALTTGGFSAWRMSNVVEQLSLCYYGQSSGLNYNPFNLANQIWTSTAYNSTTGFVTQMYLNAKTDLGANGTPYQGLAIRTFTVTGTTLS